VCGRILFHGKQHVDVYSRVIGYFMQRYEFPASPVILALILEPMMEADFRPTAASFIILAMITLVTPIIRRILKS